MVRKKKSLSRLPQGIIKKEGYEILIYIMFLVHVNIAQRRPT